MKKRIILFPFFLFTLLLLVSCSKEESEYSVWPCRFGYDNLVHQDAALASAMDYNSRGVFCLITQSTQKGQKYLNFETNNGVKTDPVPETAEEVAAKFILGINNGIIVGFQTLNTEPNGGFVAYDVQCPNCVRNENNTVNPNYRVTMDSKGIATCNRCHKTYDLNNGGIITNAAEGDTGLEKYVAVTTGPYAYITVFRK